MEGVGGRGRCFSLALGPPGSAPLKRLRFTFRIRQEQRLALNSVFLTRSLTRTHTHLHARALTHAHTLTLTNYRSMNLYLYFYLSTYLSVWRISSVTDPNFTAQNTHTHSWFFPPSSSFHR
jgi:hypothetical protein